MVVVIIFICTFVPKFTNEGYGQKRILKFLRQVMANNNREWFQEHKKEYEAVRAEYERCD